MKPETLPTGNKTSDLPQTPAEFVLAFRQLALSFQNFSHLTARLYSDQTRYVSHCGLVTKAAEVVHAADTAGLLRRYPAISAAAAFHFAQNAAPSRVQKGHGEYARSPINFLSETMLAVQSERPQDFIGKPAEKDAGLSVMFLVFADDIANGSPIAERSELNEDGALILQALIQLKADRQAMRKSQRQIVRAAFGVNAEPANFKRVFAMLCDKGLCGSAPGPKGGMWITAAGKVALEVFNQRTNRHQ